MGDGLAEGRLASGAFRVGMDPLIVSGCLGKGVDSGLVNGEPIAGAKFRIDLAG
jgi:hypothetical protein